MIVCNESKKEKSKDSEASTVFNTVDWEVKINKHIIWSPEKCPLLSGTSSLSVFP